MKSDASEELPVDTVDDKTAGKASPESLCGLNDAQVRERLSSEGYNELPGGEKRNALSIVVEVIKEPMMALLLAGGVIYFLLGDVKEAAILLALAIMSVAITVVQELRTERVLEALRDLTSPRALVVRNGERVRIAGRDVVRDDVLVLSEGDRVPADARIVTNHEMEADESLLTGESVPVQKCAGGSVQGETARPGGDMLPFVYSGSLIVRGSAICKVTATGPRSEIGKIGLSLGSVDRDPPRLRKQIQRLVRIFGVLGGSITIAALLLYGFLRGDWLNGVLASIALGMSMLPEEFPVILTVFMAMGAWRISKARVLTRRSAAIEALGAATVLCTDKTGTLTENRMSIARLVLPDRREFNVNGADTMPMDYHGLVRSGILACALDPFDPMENAFHDLLPSVFEDGHPGHSGWELTREYGLKPELLAVTQIWNDGLGDVHTVAAKGAPEAIAALCGMDKAGVERIKSMTSRMAEQGLRVLGVAEAEHAGNDWPETPHAFSFRFVGLVGLADGLRKQVPAAVASCRDAGVRVVMITGDFPATALAIARQAGIADDDDASVVTGEMLDKLDAQELAERLKDVRVFARIMPEQKLKIVQALKAGGEVVAMTGDGVNDAPSLKAADIGIAMGGRGTDVAREASSIVLLDDDFSAIVEAIRLGRRIYDNIRKATLFILALHLPIAGLALFPLAFSTPIVFWPVHIAFLEMAVDPICSLAFEAEREERNIMKRPPRAPNERLLTSGLLAWGLLQGLLTLIVSGGVYLAGLQAGLVEAELRSLTFFTLLLNIVVLVLVNRSFSASPLRAITRPNRVFWAVVAFVGAILAIAFGWPAASELFRFGPLHNHDILLALAVSAGLLLGLEFFKMVLQGVSRRYEL